MEGCAGRCLPPTPSARRQCSWLANPAPRADAADTPHNHATALARMLAPAHTTVRGPAGRRDRGWGVCGGWVGRGWLTPCPCMTPNTHAHTHTHSRSLHQAFVRMRQPGHVCVGQHTATRGSRTIRSVSCGYHGLRAVIPSRRTLGARHGGSPFAAYSAASMSQAASDVRGRWCV